MIDVIVTGAAGFIGTTLLARLRSAGLKVHGMDRTSGDIALAATWASLPRARTVIHLAGQSYVPDSWKNAATFLRNNTLSTEEALGYCRRENAHLILASTYVYGVPQHLPVGEDHPVHPSNPYALSKRLAEQLCEFSSKHHGNATTVLRLFNIYGSGQRQEFLIPTILAQVKSGTEIHIMDLSPRRDYVHVDDVADAFFLALQRPSGYSIFNIGSGVSFSVNDVIEIAQHAAGTTLPVVSACKERQSEIHEVVADIRRAQSELGWSPRVAFSDGIERLVASAA